MTALRVAPIVEGDGDVLAVPLLLRRIGLELCGGRFIDVATPIRQARDRIVHNINQTLERALALAVGKLRQRRPVPDRPDVPELVLVLVDSDEDPACRLGPQILTACRDLRPDVDAACVLAVLEFETWFVASAPSLAPFLKPGAVEAAPDSPETARSRKHWLESHSLGTYAETVDQPRFASHLDLTECRKRSPSFDKLCREIERRIPTES